MKRPIIAVPLAALVLSSGCSPEGLDIGKVLKTTVAVAEAVKDFTFDEELEIGGTIAAQIASNCPVNGDPRAREYVNLVAQTVAARSTRPDVMPRVLVLDEETPNAFACPGGYMFVTTGFLRLCRDESELAGVMGHEFAHVAKRHTLNSLRWKRGTSVAAKEAASYGPEALNQAYAGFEPAIKKGYDSIGNNMHGQGAEEEADLLGAEWAARAGYDPRGLGRVIERLPVGEKGKWAEAFSVYKNGDTRALRITKTLAAAGLPTECGAVNAERFRLAMAGVLK